MATNNYSSIYNIKKFAMDELAPKYFNIDETNDLNIGLLGFLNEYIGTVSEDSFNATSTYIREMFPHLAVMPETIYNNATLFQLNGAFTTPSNCQVYLFVSEKAVKENGTRSNETGPYEFILDSDMIIDIEGIKFMPDYDILISFRQQNGDYIYTAKYDKYRNDTDYNNSLSTATTDYLRLKRITFEGENYLQIEINAHQVEKYTYNETVSVNDVIISPRYIVNFEGELANFEIFYKAPSSDKYEQLKKKMYGSLPSEDNFCYYKIVDEGELELSFSTRDGYFYPEDNSEILVYYFTTLGSEGNFNAYSGSDTAVYASSEKYQYNNNLTVFAIPVSAATGGGEALTQDQLKRMTVEMFSTVGSYTNENDLQIYFDNFNNKYNSNILFLKTRDDIFRRRFSAYTLFKNQYDEIFSTNTLDIFNLKYSDFDKENIQDDYYMLKPGHIFTYNKYNTITLQGSDFSTNTVSSYTIPEDKQPFTGISKILHNGVSIGFTFSVTDQTIVLNTTLTSSNDDDEFIIYDDQIPTSAAMFDKNRNLRNYKYFTFKGNGTNKKFIIPKNEIFSGIDKILINGEEVFNYQFNQLDNSIEFNSPPGNNSTITVYNTNENSFVYTNPFLIYFKKSPILVNCYLNSVYSSHKLYHKYANDQIVNQFICSNLTVSRTATLSGAAGDTYNISVLVTPASAPVTDVLDENGDPNLSLKLIFTDNNDNDICYINMTIDKSSEFFNEDLKIYPFKCNLTTNDIIENDKIRMTDTSDMKSTIAAEGYNSVPIENAILKIETWYKNENDGITNPILTNTYTTELDPVTFVKSIDLIHSTGEFVDTGIPGDSRIILNSFPLVRADVLADDKTSKEFFTILSTESDYLETAMDKLTNNFSIDVKFYNSYGLSKNFKVDTYSESFISNGSTVFELENRFINISKVTVNGTALLPSEYTYNDSEKNITFETAPSSGSTIIITDDSTLDKVNIKIMFKVKFAYGTDVESTIYNMKVFIKEYIEGINENGANSIYVSNLIRELENNFQSINYLKFIGINDYSCMVQSIENSTTDLNTLTKYERLKYVPEYLTLSLDDIEIMSI